MKKIVLALLFVPSLAFAQGAAPVFIEAESFSVKGGWVVDQQYMDVMGSPVLLAHGMGEPVADAVTEITLPQTGKYNVFVRTRNWAAPWTPQYAPGKFQMSVNGQKLETVFGTEGDPWHWQNGGTVDIKDTKTKIALHDLTGFDGRLDAIIFAQDPNYTPPEDIKEIDKIRRKTLNLAATPLDAPPAKEGPFDLVVVGGGIAGICSAISAARLDCKVALIQNRPTIGGNNSSEVRVHLQGRIGYPPYPNLGNLVHELDPQHEGNAEPGEFYKDEKKLNAVKAEKNITLYLNTHIIAAETEKDSENSAGKSVKIISIVGKNIETGIETKFTGKLFADCSGDGNLGFLAGADWRMGRESKAETREDLAPENPDKMTMGASVQWYSVPAKDAAGQGVKTEFPPLPWAHQFTHESAQPMIKGDWDWETGLNDDQVWDIERIRDNGLRAAYGHWAYMKNQSEAKWREQADTRKLGWTAYIAGKRESRRLMGDIILQEQDLTQSEIYPDACFVTNWGIDLHYPEKKNEQFFSREAFRTIAKGKAIQPYAVPYRTLYSRNVSNLFMAGRCISVTHVALGTIRVMRTSGMMGEVVGMAASLAVKNDTTPRSVYEKHLNELKALMEKGIAPKPEKYWHTAQPRISQPVKKATPPASAGWVKHPDNPVIRGSQIILETVVDDNGTFKAWFDVRSERSIGYAESKDGVHWTDIKIVLAPAAGTYEEYNIDRPYVVKKDGTFYMWYTVHSKAVKKQENHGAAAVTQIAFATSTDGVNWKRMSDKPVLSATEKWENDSVMCPVTIWDEDGNVPQSNVPQSGDTQNGIWKMWYSAGGAYEPTDRGYAVSKDGLHWTKHKQPVFSGTKNGQDWDGWGIGGGSVVKHKGQYYLFYIGYKTIDYAQTGLARSKDGITNWERYQGSPIVSPGADYDKLSVYVTQVIYREKEKRWYLWYSGRNKTESPCLVTKDGEDLGFDKAKN